MVFKKRHTGNPKRKRRFMKITFAHGRATVDFHTGAQTYYKTEDDSKIVFTDMNGWPMKAYTHDATGLFEVAPNDLLSAATVFNNHKGRSILSPKDTLKRDEEVQRLSQDAQAVYEALLRRHRKMHKSDR